MPRALTARSASLGGCPSFSNGKSARGRSSRETGECPGWWLHWSQQDKRGATPSFCSVCGDRTRSRERLRGASSTLRHQVDLLKEIADRQSADLSHRAAERVRIGETLEKKTHDVVQADHAAREAEAQCHAERGEKSGALAAEIAEVDRLRQELQAWKSSHVALGLHGDDIAKAAAGVPLVGRSTSSEATGCQYSIRLENFGGLPLGVDILHEYGDICTIQHIYVDGLIGAWNAANPGREVGVGDKIFTLNGINITDYDTLSLEFRKSRVATFTLAKPPAEIHSASKMMLDRRHEEAKHQWRHNNELLERELQDIDEQSRRIALSSARRNDAWRAEFSSSFGGQDPALAQAQLRDELTAEQRGTALSAARLQQLRQEIVKETQEQAELDARSAQDVAQIAEQVAHAQRRIEVETDLVRAQRKQLRNVEADAEALRAQIHRKKLEHSELRASLKESQERLGRLRYS